MPSLLKTTSLVVVTAFLLFALYWLTIRPQTPTPTISKNHAASSQAQTESSTSFSSFKTDTVSSSEPSSSPYQTSTYNASPITLIAAASTSSVPSRLPAQPSSAIATVSRKVDSTTAAPLPPSAASSASFPTTNNTGSTQPPAWELPPGVKVPAAFLETGETLSPPAAAANEQIAQSFEAEIDTTSKAATDGATEISDTDWTKAQQRADELYRSLFGDAAYNQQGMHTAIEAKASLTETQ